jgi:hypothetical protein
VRASSAEILLGNTYHLMLRLTEVARACVAALGARGSLQFTELRLRLNSPGRNRGDGTNASLYLVPE